MADNQIPYSIARCKLTLPRLKEVISYNPETGVFINLVWRGGPTKAGTRAGALCTDTYRWIRIDGVQYSEHRLAWFYIYGKWPENQIDHINHQTTDNRISNLRDATYAQNQHNKSPQRGTRSGIKGLCYRPNVNSPKKWRAQIHIGGKQIYLGCFLTSEEAAAAYKAAAEKHFGHFAYKG